MHRRDLLRAAALAGAAASAGALAPAALAAPPAPGAPRPPGALPASPRITLRRSAERGAANHGWLDTRHTFSFASYRDPRHMGFRALRVINEDWIAGGRGFPMHPHDNMEIVTYVLAGALEHKDSLGHGGVIVPGNLQRMSAGTGIRHSEFNPSARESTHLLQVWLLPSQRNVAPSYEDRPFPATERQGRLRVVASPDGREGSLRIVSPTLIHACTLKPGERVLHPVASGRHAWLQVARGSLALNEHSLLQGDGASTSDAGTLTLVGGAQGAEVLLFDLA
ncbi:MAG: pirin family protein [Planctomycetia bacterium]